VGTVAWYQSVFQIAKQIGFRRIIMVLALLGMAFYYLKNRKRRKVISEEEEQQRIDEIYEKNNEGYYPWEVDTDDNPKRIPQNSKRMVHRWGPRRGRW